MKYEIDNGYLLETFRTLVEVPSPVGYYVRINPVMEKVAKELGFEASFSQPGTVYITVDGQDNSKTVLIDAHLDTIGLLVRKIDDNGMLRVSRLGGVNFSSAEGSSVTIHARDGRDYTGLLTTQSHSVHVFDDARTLARDENTMVVLLDADVKTRADVLALGIRHGDPVSIAPVCEYTENGYLKSRFIDDKASVACLLTAIKYLKDHGEKPAFRTIFAFPHTEEIGYGGSFVPAEVSEFVAVDIGLIGPGMEGNEHAVSICAKDAHMPYDYELTSRLIRQAEAAGINYAVDVYPHYGSDANDALTAGFNIKTAAFGMGTYCTHGRERTHMDSLAATTGLVLAYLFNI